MGLGVWNGDFTALTGLIKVEFWDRYTSFLGAIYKDFGTVIQELGPIYNILGPIYKRLGPIYKSFYPPFCSLRWMVTSPSFEILYPAMS